MTIAKMVVEIEARNRSLKSVLADSTRGVNAFVREIEKANAALAKLQIPQGGNRGGFAAPTGGQLALARGLSQEIIAEHRAAEKALRDLLKRDTITKEEFARRGQELAATTLSSARKKFESAKGALGPEVTNALIGGVERAIEKSSAAIEKGARNVRAADKFLKEVNDQTAISLANIDKAVGEGRLAASERAMARAESIAQRNEALIRKTNEMEAKNQMRPALREAMMSQLDPKGFGFGVSRTEAEKVMQDTQRQVLRLRERMQTDIANAKLNVAAGLDPKLGEQQIALAYERMNRGIEHGRRRLEKAQLLTPEITRFLSGQIVKVPKVVSPDTDEALRGIRALKDRFKTEVAEIRFDAAAKGLDPSIVTRRIALAGEELHRGLVQVRDKVKATAGTVAPEIQQALDKATVRIPKVRPAEVEQALGAIRTLKERFNTEVAGIKLDQLGGLDPVLAQRRIAAAGENLHRGLVQVRERVRKTAGTVPAEIEQALAKTAVRIPPIVPPDLDRVTREVGRLRERMQGELARIKLDALMPGVDPKVIQRRIADVRENMNAGLLQLRETVRKTAGTVSPEIEKAIAGGVVKVPKLPTLFDDIAQQIVTHRNSMQQKIASAKLDLMAGIISPAEAQQRIDHAFKSFRDAVEGGRQSLKGRNALTGEIEQEMFKAISAAERVVKRERGKVVDAQTNMARESVRAFQDTYNREIAKARLSTTTAGGIDSRGFTKAANAAKAEFNRALEDLRKDLDAKGLLTADAQRLIDRQFKQAGEVAAKSFSGKIAEGMVKAGASMKSAGQQLLQFLTLPIGGALLGAGKLAAEYEAAAGRINLVFGPELGRKVQQSLVALRQEIPATSIEVQNFAARVGEVFLPLGVIPERADKVKEGVAGMTLEFIKLTKALVVLNPGTTAERAFTALLNATVGRTTELGKLGIFVRQAAIDARALQYANDNLNKSMETSGKVYRRTSADLSPRERAMGAYLLILERGALVEKAIAFQQNNFNLQLEFTKKAMVEAGVAAGTILLPVMKELAKAVQDLFVGFQRLPKETLESAIGFAKIAVVIGPLLLGLGSLVTMLGKIAVAFKAIAAASGIGATAVALGGLLGPLTALVGLTAAGAYGWKLYKESLDGATRATFDYSQAVASMSMSELVREQGNIAEQLSALAVEQARLMDKGLAEYDRRTAGALQHAKGPNTRKRIEETVRANRKPIFTSKEDEEALNRITARIGELDRNMVTVGNSMTLARIEMEKTAAQQEDWNKKMAEFQRIAEEETLKQRLAREREEWALLNSEINTAASSMRVARRLGESLTEPYARLRELLDKVREQQNSLFVTPRRSQELENLANKIQLAIAGPKGRSEDASRLRKQWELFALDVRVAIAELNNAREAGKDVARPLERVAELSDVVWRRLQQVDIDPEISDRLRIMAVQLEAAARAAEKVNITGLTARVGFQVDEITDLAQRIQESSGTERSRITEDMFIAVVAIAETEREIGLMQQLQVGTAKQRIELEKRLLDLKKAQRTANEQLISSIDIFTPGLRGQLESFADRLKDAQVGLDIELRIPKNDEAIRQAKLQVSVIQEQIGLALRDSLSGGLFELLDKTQQAEVLRDVDKVMKQLGIDNQTFNEELERTDRILDRISIGIRGIGELFEALGVESKTMRELVQNANLVITSIKQIRAAQQARREREESAAARNPFDLSARGFDVSEMAALVSGLAGTVGAVFGIVGSLARLFGKSESRRESDEILKKNNDHLAELTSELSRFTLSIGNQLRVTRALADRDVRASLAARAFIERSPVSNAGTRGGARDEVERQLQRFGLTFADLQRVAKENGIQLLDSKGRIVAEAFDQLAKAIGLNVELLTTYGDTLADQTAKLDLRSNVFDIEQTPQQIIKDQLALLQKLAPDLFQQFFAGIDPADTSAVEEANRRMTEALLSGAIDLSQYGNLLNKEELARIITGLETGLDGLADATNKATESMLNVPTWFRTNQIRFESVDPFMPPSATPEPPAPPTPLPPGVGKPPLGPGGVNAGLTVQGDVNLNITQQPGEDGQALAERVVAELRADKFMRTGTTRLPGIDD